MIVIEIIIGDYRKVILISRHSMLKVKVQIQLHGAGLIIWDGAEEE